MKKKSKKANARGKRSPAAAPQSWIAHKFEGVSRLALAGVAGSIIIVTGLVGLLWAGGYVGVMAESLDRSANARLVSAGLGVKRVTLLGRRDAARDDLSDAIGPVVGQSMLHIDLDAVRARVEALGWVRSAAVSRLWPDTVHISVREREPAAVWQLSGALHLIDAEGAVIRQIGAYEYSALPLIVGAGAPEPAAELLQALRGQPELEKMTAALVRVSARRWNLRLRNKTDILLPERDFDDALEALSILQAAHGTLDQQFEYIDLRDPERVVVRKPENAS
ncbi:MAG: cell division protein FtsQ/DivIB [Pseudomonadota bacterium]